MGIDQPHLDDACEDGEHVLVPGEDAGVTVCQHCELSSQAIVDWLGHATRDPASNFGAGESN